MNVTIEKNGNVNAVITVSLEEKDYQDKVTKDLKTIGLKHRIDGFRPGKVPAGILKKMFGKQVLADVVNRETVDALFNFIKENNLSVLGEPLAEESQEVDLSQKEYAHPDCSRHIPGRADKTTKIFVKNGTMIDKCAERLVF